ncbi:MAG: hypothetical protein IJ604_09480 [Prevotella sp.]|nr:hypothetical protein [Prevotella sp.]
MDTLTKELQAFLVMMHYQPDRISHQMEHYMEHLLHLLPPDDEEAVLHYFGILGHEQLSLNELAQERSLSPEDMMQQIDQHLRRLAVTPEWQMLKTTEQNRKHNE